MGGKRLAGEARIAVRFEPRPGDEDIVEFLQSLPAEKACVGAPLATRQLRLLTRREYSNSIRDVFGQGTSCGERTFTWRANGRRPSSVHVAGSFNGWPANPPGPEWQLVYVAEVDAYEEGAF